MITLVLVFENADGTTQSGLLRVTEPGFDQETFSNPRLAGLGVPPGGATAAVQWRFPVLLTQAEIKVALPALTCNLVHGWGRTGPSLLSTLLFHPGRIWDLGVRG